MSLVELFETYYICAFEWKTEKCKKAEKERRNEEMSYVIGLGGEITFAEFAHAQRSYAAETFRHALNLQMCLRLACRVQANNIKNIS